VRRYALSSFQSGLVVSMSLLGALLGSLIALASGNKLGRRTELLMAAVLYGALKCYCAGARLAPICGVAHQQVQHKTTLLATAAMGWHKACML
jgi:MFS family permease